MQIESLKCFCDLVETESFTKAAQINGVTQSAISQGIAVLEGIFNTLLVERSKKQLRLTREGQALYDASKHILETYAALDSTLQKLKGVISGDIRVAAIYSVGLHHLPPYLKKFMQSFPTVNIRVKYRHSNQIYDDVYGKVADIGLIAYPVKSSKLEIVPLHKEPLVLICHPRHPFAKLKNIKLKQLEGQKIIGIAQELPTRMALDKILNEYDVKLNYVMEFDNEATIKRAVEIDAGIAIVPKSTVTQEVENGLLAAVELEHGRLLRPIAAIYRKDRVLPPGMKEFLALLKT